MWATLSAATQRHLGPTIDGFRARSAGALRRELAPFAHEKVRIFLEEQTDVDLAVEGISGGAAVYAAAFRYEQGGWYVAIDPSLRIQATLPRPGSRIFQRTKVLAEIVARVPVTSASVWFDGSFFPAEGARTDAEHAGVLGEAPQPLRSGRHIVVAFATAGESAAARAWSFTSYGGPYRGSLAPYG